jgi:hypothetical protein
VCKGSVESPPSDDNPASDRRVNRLLLVCRPRTTLDPVRNDGTAYEEKVAALLAEFGGKVVRGETLVGARGKHETDVTLRTHHYGIDQLWICECKDWNRRVPKERVLTFQGIVEDVGADRGLMFSEEGFQAGGIRMAQNSNLTLTSIEDLRESGQRELADVAIRRAAAETRNLLDRSSALHRTERLSKSQFALGAAPGMTYRDLTDVENPLNMLEDGLLRGVHDQYPVRCGWTEARDAIVTAATPGDLVDYARATLEKSRPAVERLEAAALAADANQFNERSK